jgi:cytoskeletal protein CcmA (bactofilin family)
MFKKREQNLEDVRMNNYEKDYVKEVSKQKVNTILKGSKLTGDINVSCDLELSGEVEGNITSEQNSNIVIKGICKGNIKTREGNVNIEGELGNGDIIAGGNVKITGKFNGGKVEAKEKIYINGEFHGKLESTEIEVGPNAKGEGELFYREYISISRGAKVEAHISQIQGELKVKKKSADMKVVNLELPAKEIG